MKANINVNLGKDTSDNDVYLDFAKEQLRFVLLVGTTGSGKTIFHNNLYRELSKQNAPEEVTFMFLDMTRVDFVSWKSPYLYKPAVVDHEEAFAMLEEFAELSILRSVGKEDSSRAIFIHIEECDLFCIDITRLKHSLVTIASNKRSNMYVIFSTSRPSRDDVMQDWFSAILDLRVVFNLANPVDCKTVGAPNDVLDFKPGQRLLLYNDKQIACKPFPTAEAEELAEFEL